MTKQQWHKFMAKAHKWVGLILGVQLVFWTVGGVVMSWIPIETVRGEHKIAEQPAAPLRLNNPFISLERLAHLAGANITTVRYVMMLEEPVAKLQFADGRREIRSAATGALLSPLSADMAKKLAVADFKPGAAATLVEEVNTPSVDYRGAFPVWRVTFEDTENTALYVSPTEGRIVARRSSIWRFYDFFWMLHIMDYDERHDFNNPLVMATSFFAVLFAISGITLLFFRFYRRDFNFLLGKKSRQ